MIELENILKEAEESIIAATDLSMLDDLRVEYLERKADLLVYSKVLVVCLQKNVLLPALR